MVAIHLARAMGRFGQFLGQRSSIVSLSTFSRTLNASSTAEPSKAFLVARMDRKVLNAESISVDDGFRMEGADFVILGQRGAACMGAIVRCR